MADTLSLSTARKNAQIDNFASSLNNGSIRLYTASGGTLIATLTFAATAFAAASAGSATANAIGSGTSVAAGTMTYAEFLNSSSTVVATTTVGVTGGNKGLEFATNVVGGAGVTISMSSLTFTHS